MNKQYKDSVFVDYFSKDKFWKKHFLSVYNALFDTNLTEENCELENVNLEQVLYMNYYNDVSVKVNNKIIVLLEHQSTVNPNMPLRMLEYIARIYEKIIPAKEKYTRKKLSIPLPQFFVFYNGKEKLPKEMTLKLSDLFTEKTNDFTLDLEVKLCNINSEEGHPLLHKSEDLNQYSQFVALVEGAKILHEKDFFTKAIRQALKQGILQEYLQRKSKEVENMLVSEYDYATDIAVQREEAREEGIEIGLEQGIEKGAYQNKIETAKNFLKSNVAVELISKCTGLSLETVQKLASEIEV